MTTTLRSPIDGTTQEVDNADKGRLDRLVEMGYLVVGQPALVTASQPSSMTARANQTRKRTAAKK